KVRRGGRPAQASLRATAERVIMFLNASMGELPSNRNTYECASHCGATFDRRGDVAMHLEAVHHEGTRANRLRRDRTSAQEPGPVAGPFTLDEVKTIARAWPRGADSLSGQALSEALYRLLPGGAARPVHTPVLVGGSYQRQPTVAEWRRGEALAPPPGLERDQPPVVEAPPVREFDAVSSARGEVVGLMF